MSNPPLQLRGGGSGQDPSRGEQPGHRSRPCATAGPAAAGSAWQGEPLSCSLPPAAAKRAGCSAAARTMVIILINPLHAEYCGLLAGPSHTISISRQAGGSQIAHAG